MSIDNTKLNIADFALGKKLKFIVITLQRMSHQTARAKSN